MTNKGAFPLFFCCYFILLEIISLEFASAKGEELGKNKAESTSAVSVQGKFQEKGKKTGKNRSRINICSVCSGKIPRKRGKPGKNQSRINICSVCPGKISGKRTGPPPKFWEKMGISLAIPPNGTREEKQEQPEQEIWRDWENIKRLY